MSDNDTIVAQATPPGRGGVGILRISGLKAREVAETVLGKLPKPRYADYLPFKDADGSVLDQGIALWFPGPNSFTGEDVLELQGHGGPVILDLLLKRILTIPGLRIARPGEFSERAFLNDKLDLAQAEAIADLIDASSEQAARSALNSLQGAFSARVNHLVEALTHLRIYVEAAIDFPDEEIDFLSDGKIEAQLNDVIADLDAVRAEARQGSLLREGMKVVIAGRPNAGKSSLLNALAGREAAIVTDIAGTTRDVLREHIHWKPESSKMCWSWRNWPQVSCALCYSRLWADNGKTIHPRCVFPTIARSNRYNQAFCPAVPSSISPGRYFPA